MTSSTTGQCYAGIPGVSDLPVHPEWMAVPPAPATGHHPWQALSERVKKWEGNFRDTMEQLSSGADWESQGHAGSVECTGARRDDMDQIDAQFRRAVDIWDDFQATWAVHAKRLVAARDTYERAVTSFNEASAGASFNGTVSQSVPSPLASQEAVEAAARRTAEEAVEAARRAVAAIRSADETATSLMHRVQR